jgi:soluble lytic murein transglycosylase-like protein
MGNGILTDGGSGDGILVHKNADDGILVHRNTDDGILVHRTGDGGILVHKTGGGILFDDPALDQLVEKAARDNGIPPGILMGLVKQESNWNPNAVSPAGAAGLMQLMPGTASGLGLTSDERFDPAKAVPAAAKYLKDQYDHFAEACDDVERWRFALASYNAGRGAVNGVIQRKANLKGIKNIFWIQVAQFAPQETQGYVEKILGSAGDAGGYAREYGYNGTQTPACACLLAALLDY